MVYGHILYGTEKECVKTVEYSKATIGFVQHCAAISAMAELFVSNA